MFKKKILPLLMTAAIATSVVVPAMSVSAVNNTSKLTTSWKTLKVIDEPWN